MKNSLLTIILFASGVAMNGADRCGTPAPSAALRALMQSNDTSWQRSPHRLSPTDVVIPLQFNVIRRNDGSGDVTDAQIFNQIDVMNERFRSSRLRLSLRGISRTNNSVWATGGNPNELAAAISQTFAFGAPNSNEAMMVKILDPGSYTVIVEAESGAHGIALVEVYDVNAY